MAFSRPLSALPPEVRQYLVVTGNYWAFTLTDGALRLLVLLYFHELGYSPLQLAMLFLLYEFFGVVTNLLGGWLGARIGLNRTMNTGLALQVLALGMLLVPAPLLTVPWVMAAQALSGIAKDLNKMSAKSAIKALVPAQASSPDSAQTSSSPSAKLYRWVALLTGSKNALKGIGFFAGALLLDLLGFRGAIALMAGLLIVVFCASLRLLHTDLGRARNKPRFRDLFSKSAAINRLSAARMFLFAGRDVWFVVALPVALASQFDWDHWQVGAFLALWVIGYGLVQALAPRITGYRHDRSVGIAVRQWGLALAGATGATCIMVGQGIGLPLSLLAGLGLFGVLFAINSALHSFLVVHYARADGVSLDVGFYYMANAAGRLLGTLLSGWVFQVWGLSACLGVSATLLLVAALLAGGLREATGQPSAT